LGSIDRGFPPMAARRSGPPSRPPPFDGRRLDERRGRDRADQGEDQDVPRSRRHDGSFL